MSILAFLRLSTPASVVVEPTTRHLHVLAGLLAGVGTGGNLVSDAHLAALAVEHDATVITYDNDFGRFPGLRWEPPAVNG
ncbi:MAG: PIN domain-containing protein [Actinobacteria bacterium]|nr:PIN domain-containing protein [Actinomycetota bacterium]